MRPSEGGKLLYRWYCIKKRGVVKRILLDKHCREESESPETEAYFRSEIRGLSGEIVDDERLQDEDRRDGDDVDEPEVLDVFVPEVVPE